MTFQIEDPRQPLGPDELVNHTGPQEIEIAYLLQNSQPGDRNLVDILVDSYAEELHWLMRAILFKRLGRTPSPSEVDQLVTQAFVTAINQCDRFWGEASVRKWLYSLAIRVAHASSRKSSYLRFSEKGNLDQQESGDDLIPQAIDHPLASDLERLPERQFLVLVLHFLFGLTLQDAAEMLGEKTNKAHEWLVSLRHRLLAEDTEQSERNVAGYSLDGEHKINRSRIQARIDGLLEQNSKDAILLREHLTVCEACRAYDEAMARLWERLISNLRDCLPPEPLSNEYLDQLKRSILERLSTSRRDRRIRVPLGKAAWISLLLLLFVSGTWAMIQITPEIGEFPATVTPTTRYMPTPVVPGAFPAANYPPAEEEGFLAAYALTPKVSADGRWIAFTSNVDLAGSGDLSNWLSVLLYDTQTGTLESISSQVIPVELGFYNALDISADGRWIVYQGMVDSMADGDEACRSPFFDPSCMDIFLYDRVEGQLRRLTHGYDGSFANGHSMSPSISSNGRWIVFWSAASNLVEGAAQFCESGEQVSVCSELFVYDRINDRLDQIPIGRSNNIEQEFASVFPTADISDDGLWLLLTLLESDRISEEAELENEMDVFIYSREKNVFMPVNVASDGTDGNGLSGIAKMTPDGRYVVFYSSSDNLVVGDTNNYGDIFLLDRTDGEVELISKAPDGTQANGENGSIDMGIGSVLSISDDGRYIVYTSTATNLDPRSPGSCEGETDTCIFVYFYDLNTGETKRIAEREENHFALMPDISGDGSLVSYVDVNMVCTHESEVCLDLKYYDQESTWTSEITRNLFPREGLVWELDSILETESENVFDIEFSPDGGSIALAEVGPLIEIKSVPDGRLMHTLRGTKSTSILVIAFSPDGEFIAGGGSDGTVSIWRTTDGSLAYRLDDHPQRIIDLQFSVDGNYLFVATHRSVWGWRIQDRVFTRLYALDYADITIKDMHMSPTNNLIAIAPATEPYVWIQRVPGGDIIHRLAGYGRNLSSVSFSADNNYLISQFSDGLTQFWRMNNDGLSSLSPELVKEFVLPGPLGKVTFSSDGLYAAVGSSYGGVYVWDMPPGGRRQLIPESSRTIYIDDVDFSPSGSMLAAASRDGIYLWHNKNAAEEMEFFRQISTDEFIQIPNRRRPLQDALTGLRLDHIEADGLTLYQADEQSALEVYAPFKLPPHVSFVASSLMNDGGVLSKYRVYDPFTGLEAAYLYFLQQPLTEAFRPFWIGSSGAVERIESNGRPAEFVKGDWLSLSTLGSDRTARQDSQDLYWAWSSKSDVQQLRWRHLNQLFSLTYIPEDKLDSSDESGAADLYEGKISIPFITKYDLIEIASNISELRATSNTEPILIDYTIRSGDTCTSIANNYGTTVEHLIRINNLENNCDVIVIGETLQVPLPNEHLPLFEADLDCDGQQERLRFIPVPGFQTSNISFGFVLDTLSNLGLYETVWHYTIGDVDAVYLIGSQLISVDACQSLLAVNLLQFPNYYQDNEPGLEVFLWDGESMESVFSADGWLQSADSADNGEATLTTLSLEYLPDSFTCNRLNVEYTWDGTGFSETARYTIENASCDR